MDYKNKPSDDQLKDWKDLSQPGYTTPDAHAWISYQRDIYASLRPPIFCTTPSDWETIARSRVPAPNFNYVFGSAGSGKTNQSNLCAFDRYRLRPKMLVNATRRDMSVELFGTKYSSPLLVAPVGVQEIIHPDAEEATAKACRTLGVPMVLSTAATRSLEQVAKASAGGDLWYQLYWPKPQHDEVTASLLHRAKTNGYKVLVVTLDTFSLAWRPNDLNTSYLPFIWGQGCQIGFSDPVFNEHYANLKDDRTTFEKVREAWDIMTRSGTLYGAARVLAYGSVMSKARAWIEILNSGTFREWQHLEVLKKLWDGPIVLKGIQSVEDAHRAIDYGMSGIVVSNHGGRQVDGAMASLDALAEITADNKVQKSNITVLFDSGIRTGSDIIKAIALGAKAVMLGRPFMYGLAIQGQQGVEHVLKCMLAETDSTLANMGQTSLRDLSRSDLQILSG